MASLSNADLIRAYLLQQLPSNVSDGTVQPTPGGGSVDAISETVIATATVVGNNTSAGVAVVTIAAGSLPAGIYNVEVVDTITAAATPALVNNLELRVGGVSRRPIFHIAAVQASSAAPFGDPQKCYVRLDGTKNLSVNYIANFGAAETQTHTVLLMATKIDN